MKVALLQQIIRSANFTAGYEANRSGS